MKQLLILIAEDGDFRDVSNSPSGVAYKSELRQPILHADLVVQIKKSGETKVFKNRHTADLTSLVEELSSAYAENKI